jgi:hypothetical protein
VPALLAGEDSLEEAIVDFLVEFILVIDIDYPQKCQVIMSQNIQGVDG